MDPLIQPKEDPLRQLKEDPLRQLKEAVFYALGKYTGNPVSDMKTAHKIMNPEVECIWGGFTLMGKVSSLVDNFLKPRNNLSADELDFITNVCLIEFPCYVRLTLIQWANKHNLPSINSHIRRVVVGRLIGYYRKGREHTKYVDYARFVADKNELTRTEFYHTDHGLTEEKMVAIADALRLK